MNYGIVLATSYWYQDSYSVTLLKPKLEIICVCVFRSPCMVSQELDCCFMDFCHVATSFIYNKLYMVWLKNITYSQKHKKVEFLVHKNQYLQPICIVYMGFYDYCCKYNKTSTFFLPCCFLLSQLLVLCSSTVVEFLFPMVWLVNITNHVFQVKLNFSSPWFVWSVLPCISSEVDLVLQLVCLVNITMYVKWGWPCSSCGTSPVYSTRIDHLAIQGDA